MNADRFGLPVAVVEMIGKVLASHPRVDGALIYGSRAKGNYKNGSDIDLTVLGEALDFSELLKLTAELDDLPIPYTVDLSVFRLIDHAGLREPIERVGQEFYLREVAGL